MYLFQLKEDFDVMYQNLDQVFDENFPVVKSKLLKLFPEEESFRKNSRLSQEILELLSSGEFRVKRGMSYH